MADELTAPVGNVALVNHQAARWFPLAIQHIAPVFKALYKNSDVAMTWLIPVI